MDVLSSSHGVAPRKPLPLRTVVLVLGALATITVFLLWKSEGLGGHEIVRLATGFPAEQVYVLKKSKLHLVDIAVPGVLEDYEKEKGTKAAIVRLPTGAFEVFLLRGGAKQLTTDGLRKSSLALSPDGTWIAYAALTTLDPEATEKISSWTVYVLNIASGEATPLIAGYAPQFFTRDGSVQLLFTSSDGLALAHPETLTVQTDFMTVADDLSASAVISADGSYVAMKDGTAGTYAILEVEQLSPRFYIHSIGEITDPLTSVAFGNGILFGIEGTPEASTLYAYTLGNVTNRELLTALPPALSPYTLLP